MVRIDYELPENFFEFIEFCNGFYFLLQIKKGPEKGKIIEVVKRKLTMNDIRSVSLRFVKSF